MDINIRLEGGIGDCILGCRFIPAIKEYHGNVDVNVKAYIDSEGNPIQKEVIDYIYPSMFAETITIQKKKYKKLVIETPQFGEEEVKGFIENVPDEIYKEMINCDMFYDLHIDSLRFLNDINGFEKYFYKIPKPEYTTPVYIGRYLCSHLISESSQVHRLEKWYITSLVEKIDNMCKEHKMRHIIISTENTNHFFNEALKNCSVSHIMNGSVKDVCDFVNGASAFIGVDSAWRLIAHSNNIPTITFSKDCNGYAGVPISHKLRWLLWPETTFGLNYDINIILNLMEGMLNNPLIRLIPEIGVKCKNEAVFNNIAVNRIYTVNHGKSVLNEI